MFRIPKKKQLLFCGIISNSFSKADNIGGKMKALVGSKQNVAKGQISHWIEEWEKFMDISNHSSGYGSQRKMWAVVYRRKIELTYIRYSW